MRIWIAGVEASLRKGTEGWGLARAGEPCNCAHSPAGPTGGGSSPAAQPTQRSPLASAHRG